MALPPGAKIEVGGQQPAAVRQLHQLLAGRPAARPLAHDLGLPAVLQRGRNSLAAPEVRCRSAPAPAGAPSLPPGRPGGHLVLPCSRSTPASSGTNTRGGEARFGRPGGAVTHVDHQPVAPALSLAASPANWSAVARPNPATRSSRRRAAIRPLTATPAGPRGSGPRRRPAALPRSTVRRTLVPGLPRGSRELEYRGVASMPVDGADVVAGHQSGSAAGDPSRAAITRR